MRGAVRLRPAGGRTLLMERCGLSLRRSIESSAAGITPAHARVLNTILPGWGLQRHAGDKGTHVFPPTATRPRINPATSSRHRKCSSPNTTVSHLLSRAGPGEEAEAALRSCYCVPAHLTCVSAHGLQPMVRIYPIDLSYYTICGGQCKSFLPQAVTRVWLGRLGLRLTLAKARHRIGPLLFFGPASAVPLDERGRSWLWIGIRLPRA